MGQVPSRFLRLPEGRSVGLAEAGGGGLRAAGLCGRAPRRRVAFFFPVSPAPKFPPPPNAPRTNVQEKTRKPKQE